MRGASPNLQSLYNYIVQDFQDKLGHVDILHVFDPNLNSVSVINRVQTLEF